MISPKNYISWSQIYLWRKNPQAYIDQYVYGKEPYTNEYMDFGGQVASALENGGCDDPSIELLIQTFPAYPKREKEYKASIKFGNETIELLAKFDGINTKDRVLGEYKTGTMYTQKKANDSEQLRIYHLIYYLKHKKLLNHVYLHWAETEMVDGQIKLTGNVKTFEVKHSLLDLIKEQMEIKKIYKQISSAYKQEIKKLK